MSTVRLQVTFLYETEHFSYLNGLNLIWENILCTKMFLFNPHPINILFHTRALFSSCSVIPCEIYDLDVSCKARSLNVAREGKDENIQHNKRVVGGC